MNYKHTETGEVITEKDYHDLSSYEQIDYEPVNSGSFLGSAIIGGVTDSALLGGLLGGDILGGVVGDLLDGDLMD